MALKFNLKQQQQQQQQQQQKDDVKEVNEEFRLTAEEKKVLDGTTVERRSLILDQWQKNWRAQRQHLSLDRAFANALDDDCCPHCQLHPSGCASSTAKTMFDTESLIRHHIFICRARKFECPFADCKQTFGWEMAYPSKLPFKAHFSEKVWWTVLNICASYEKR
jgi:hypothetical protein